MAAAKRAMAPAGAVAGKAHITVAWRMMLASPLFETVSLVQTSKIRQVPIVLYGSAFWGPLLDWLKQTMQTDYEYISPADLDLVTFADTPEPVVAAMPLTPQGNPGTDKT